MLQDAAMVIESRIVTSTPKKTEMVLMLSGTAENCKRKCDILHARHFSPQQKFKRTLNNLKVLNYTELSKKKYSYEALTKSKI